jgi:carboxylesterase
VVLIHPQAESFLLTGQGDTACLFIHGFTASPSEVYPVARLIYEMTGCTVSGPLLPGHGTSPGELNQTKWQDWFARVEQEVNYLHRRYTRVFVAGLSMGGLLALHVARKTVDLQGVIAINPPIFTKSPVLMATAPLMRYLRPYYPKKMDQAVEKLEELGRFAYPVLPVKALISMHSLRKIVMQEISGLTIPILLFQSSLDESVDPWSAEYIKEKAVKTRVKLVELRNSEHIATMGEEKLIIAEEIALLMKRA